MAAGEFHLIDDYFARGWPVSPQVSLGVGDDAALIRPGTVGATEAARVACGVASRQTAWPVRHPHEHGNAVARNAVTEAAMKLACQGAAPQWMTMGLTLPETDSETAMRWLAGFRQTLNDKARRWDISLVGGDTTRGPLTVTLFIQGVTARSSPMRASSVAVDAVVLRSNRFQPRACAALVRSGHVLDWEPDSPGEATAGAAQASPAGAGRLRGSVSLETWEQTARRWPGAFVAVSSGHGRDGED